jgi:hypothetical protein
MLAACIRKLERIHQLARYLMLALATIVHGGHNAGPFMVVGCTRNRNYWFDADARYLILTRSTAA